MSKASAFATFWAGLWPRLRYYYKAWRRLELMNKAASLSFYTIISIFPMILILATVLGSVFSQAEILSQMTLMIEEALPYQSQIVMSNLQSLVGKKMAFSWVGVASLLLSAQMLYVNMERIINGILHTPRQRHFMVSRLFFIFWLMAIVLLVLLPINVELISHSLKQWGLDVSPVARVSARGGFFIASLLIFIAVLLLVPTRRIRSKRLLWGALFFAASMQFGKFFFKWITLANFDRYNIVYGSLSTMILGTLWIFYYYNLFLFFVYWVGREHDPLYLSRK